MLFNVRFEKKKPFAYSSTCGDEVLYKSRVILCLAKLRTVCLLMDKLRLNFFLVVKCLCDLVHYWSLPWVLVCTMEGVYVRPHLFVLHLLFIGLFGWSPWEFLNFRPDVFPGSARVLPCECVRSRSHSRHCSLSRNLPFLHIYTVPFE